MWQNKNDTHFLIQNFVFLVTNAMDRLILLQNAFVCIKVAPVESCFRHLHVHWIYNNVRARPLMIWGGGRRKLRKKNF